MQTNGSVPGGGPPRASSRRSDLLHGPVPLLPGVTPVALLARRRRYFYPPHISPTTSTRQNADFATTSSSPVSICRRRVTQAKKGRPRGRRRRRLLWTTPKPYLQVPLGRQLVSAGRGDARNWAIGCGQPLLLLRRARVRTAPFSLARRRRDQPDGVCSSNWLSGSSGSLRLACLSSVCVLSVEARDYAMAHFEINNTARRCCEARQRALGGLRRRPKERTDDGADGRRAEGDLQKVEVLSFSNGPGLVVVGRTQRRRETDVSVRHVHVDSFPARSQPSNTRHEETSDGPPSPFVFSISFKYTLYNPFDVLPLLHIIKNKTKRSRFTILCRYRKGPSVCPHAMEVSLT